MFNFLQKEKHQNQNEKKFDILLTPDELFDRKNFNQVGQEEFWKMTGQQIEEVAKQQDRYIKNVKKLYQQSYDEAQGWILKFSEYEKERPKLYSNIEELQMQYDSMKGQRDILQRNLQELQSKNNDIRNSELVIRLQDQCTQLSEELSELQEENEILNQALETERANKQKIFSTKNAEIGELNKQIKTLQSNNDSYQHQLEFLTTEFQDLQLENSNLKNQIDLISKNPHPDTQKFIESQTQKVKEEYIVQLKELESKLVQERIKFDQKSKDSTRQDNQLNELKQEVERLFNLNTQLESQKKTKEVSHARLKEQLHEMKSKLKQKTEEITEQNIKFQQMEAKLDNERSNYEAKLFQLNEQFQNQLFNDFQTPINEQIQNQVLQDQIISLQDQVTLKSLDLEDKKGKISNLYETISNQEKQIFYLQQKREFAIEEIKKLNTLINQQQLTIQTLHNKVKSQQLGDISQIVYSNNHNLYFGCEDLSEQRINQSLSTPTSNITQTPIQHTEQEIQPIDKFGSIFSQLNMLLIDVSKTVDSIHKKYINILVNQEKIIKQEKQFCKQLYDIEVDITQTKKKIIEIMEFLEDMGVI